MHFLYSLLWYLVAPLLPLRLWWRGRREPGYRDYICERYGRYAGTARPPVIWIHAVSLGETRAAMPLVGRLQKAFPEATLLLTHMTATGRAAGRDLFGDRVIQAWLPYDLPFAVRGFFAHFAPAVGIVMETELWPNLVALAEEAGIPIFLVNARMSEKSAIGYARVPALTRPMMASLSGIAAQSESDAQRFVFLGADAPAVVGNLKFDLDVPEAARTLGDTLRRRFGGRRPLWVAGATRDGEEAMILDAIAAHPLPPGTLTVIVPRHPQRFDAVGELLRQRGIAFVRRSDNTDVPRDISVVLGDSMGEMLAYYQAADVAFVGGSLAPLGGQNLIEALAVGTPVLIGPHTFNFSDATRGAIAAGAASRVPDADALVAAARALLTDPDRRQAMSRAALAFQEAHRGAGDRLWEWIEPKLVAQGLSCRARD